MQEQNRKRQHSLLLLTLGATLPLLLIVPITQPGCGAASCTPQTNDPEIPGVSAECQAGTLCYQGECVETCNAGGELADECMSDDDCGGGRPFCNEGFCSSCEVGTRCIPQLDICAQVSELMIDAGNGEVDRPPAANPPLDGGMLDIPVIDFSPPDEEDPAPDLPVSHTATLTIAQITSPRASPRDQAEISLEVVRLDTTTVQPGEVIDTRTTSEGHLCTLSRREQIVGPAAADDFGIINIAIPKLATPSTDDRYTLDYNANLGRYELLEPEQVPTLLLCDPTPGGLGCVFSTADTFETLTILGTGNALTGGSWPRDNDEKDHHIPFRLRPTTGADGTRDTQSLLESGVVIPAVQTELTAFGWQLEQTLAGTLVRNSPPGTGVKVYFESPSYRFECRTLGDESNPLLALPSTLIQRFRELNFISPQSPVTFPLYMERAYERQVGVNTNVETATKIRFIVSIKSVWVSTIRL